MAEEQSPLIQKEKHKNKVFRFLKPCTTDLKKAVPIPNNPLLSDIFPQNLPEWPSKVLFRGWRFPQKKWKEWSDRLSGNYSGIWKKTGIHDAILASHYVVPRNQDLVLGLSEFWSPETNTFVFPWGEATVTLEDIMILGGLQVSGEPVFAPFYDETTKKIEQGLERERAEVCKSSAKKADQSSWMNRFMEKKGEFEHAAFLSLWLSRYVFPTPHETVGNYVIPIAARISQGTKLALAPATAAGIYRDLRVIKEGVLGFNENITVTGPFQLVQLWAFERFSLLGPKSPNPLKDGEPRVARWHKLMSKVSNLPLVRSALRVEGNFEWRPYAVELENWRHMSCYGETEKTLSFNELSFDEELKSFIVCLKGCELIGLDCEEKYFPHRVAMQFGLDQDLPSDENSVVFAHEKDKFFVPPWDFRSCASDRYATWWDNMMADRKKVLQGVLKEEKYARIIKKCHGSVASTDCVNPKSCPPAPEKSRTIDIHDFPPGFNAKYGSTSSGKRVSCDQPENVVSSKKEKVDENSVKRKLHDADGRADTAKKVKIEDFGWENDPNYVDLSREEAEPSKKCSDLGKGISCDQPDNVVPSKKEKVDENSEKRKSHDVDKKAATAKKVKIEDFVWENDPIYVDLLKEDTKLSKKCCDLGVGVAEKGKRAGETSDYPINIDDPMEYSNEKPQNPALDIEERVAKLEKMVGLKK